MRAPQIECRYCYLLVSTERFGSGTWDTHIFGDCISKLNLTGLFGEEIYEHEGSRAVGQQENVVLEDDLGDLTVGLVEMNPLERGCTHAEVGSEAVEVVEANMDDVNLCFLHGFCSIEEPEHDNSEAILSLPWDPLDEKVGQEGAGLISGEGDW